MLKKRIKYEDFNGLVREEDYYFNFTKSELTEMEYGTAGGVADKLVRIVAAVDTPKILQMFKDLVISAYGVKSDDGRSFIKNDSIRDAFKCSAAYDELMTSLVSDPDEIIAFINGVLPKDMRFDTKEVKAILDAQDDESPLAIVDRIKDENK